MEIPDEAGILRTQAWGVRFGDLGPSQPARGVALENTVGLLGMFATPLGGPAAGGQTSKGRAVPDCQCCCFSPRGAMGTKNEMDAKTSHSAQWSRQEHPRGPGILEGNTNFQGIANTDHLARNPQKDVAMMHPQRVCRRQPWLPHRKEPGPGGIFTPSNAETATWGSEVHEVGASHEPIQTSTWLRLQEVVGRAQLHVPRDHAVAPSSKGTAEPPRPRKHLDEDALLRRFPGALTRVPVLNGVGARWPRSTSPMCCSASRM